MTFVMSTEGDSVKSALSEANDKNATDNHTDDSSQDSIDAKEVSPEKPVENNVSAEKEEKPKEESTEGESEPESEHSVKKDDAAAKKEDKPEENDAKSEKENDVKPDNKEAKSEEEEEEEEEDEDEEKSKKDESKSVKETKNAKKEKDKENQEEEEEEEEEAEDEEDEDEDKKEVPLLDQPLQTSGKRERKNVQRFEEDSNKKDPPKVEFEEGSGTPLGDIPRVEATISRFKGEDLKLLHRILFKLQGKHTFYKKNIRKFNGFAFEKDSDEYKKKVDFLKKSDVKHLKTVCEILDLNKNGNKDELVDKIMEFLMEPKDSGKPLGGTGRPKRASAVRANNRGYSSHDDYSSDDRHSSRARRDKGKRANLKDDSSSDEEFKPGNVSDASDEKPKAVGKRKRGRPKKGSSEEEDEEEASLSGGSSDESDDVPKSKRRKSVGKVNSKVKKTPGKRGRPSKAAAAAAATPRSKGKRGRKPKDVSSDDDEDEKNEGSSSEDEPLVKKKAKTSEPPTDDEIKTFIKSVLEGANLEEITMKTVCQRVYDNYPDFDLTARKNFIKSTVKSLIST